MIPRFLLNNRGSVLTCIAYRLGYGIHSPEHRRLLLLLESATLNTYINSTLLAKMPFLARPEVWRPVRLQVCEPPRPKVWRPIRLNVWKKPGPKCGNRPGQSVDTTPSLSVETDPARSVESLPARSVETLPARTVESNPVVYLLL